MTDIPVGNWNMGDTPTHQRVREIVDTHFPNYARQTVPVSITELENAIAAALEEEIEACARVAETLTVQVGDGPVRKIADGYWIAEVIRQRKGAR